MMGTYVASAASLGQATPCPLLVRPIRRKEAFRDASRHTYYVLVVVALFVPLQHHNQIRKVGERSGYGTDCLLPHCGFRRDGKLGAG